MHAERYCLEVEGGRWLMLRHAKTRTRGWMDPGMDSERASGARKYLQSLETSCPTDNIYLSIYSGFSPFIMF